MIVPLISIVVGSPDGEMSIPTTSETTTINTTAPVLCDLRRAKCNHALVLIVHSDRLLFLFDHNNGLSAK